MDKVLTHMWLIILLAVIAVIVLAYGIYPHPKFAWRFIMRIRLQKPITLAPKDKATNILKEGTVECYQELQNVDVLREELKTVIKKEAWVAWQTGYHFKELLNDKSISDEEKGKIKQVILIHPDCVNIPPAISNTANFAQDIRNTTREAINKGIEVRWIMTLPTNVVIRDPRNEEASIRIEAYMVNIPTHQWPNFIITKKYQQRLFSKIITAYTKLWEDKEQMYIPQPKDYQEKS